jgi:cell division protein FtsZ
LPESEGVSAADETAEPAADDTPSEAPTRRRWLTPGAAPVTEEAPEAPAEPAAPAPRVKLGGTLFERMSSVSRGAGRDEDPAPDKDPLDIPRFLHRQNNQ